MSIKSIILIIAGGALIGSGIIVGRDPATLAGNTDHHDMLVVLLGAMALFMTFVLLIALGFLITVIAR